MTDRDPSGRQFCLLTLLDSLTSRLLSRPPSQRGPAEAAGESRHSGLSPPPGTAAGSRPSPPVTRGPPAPPQRPRPARPRRSPADRGPLRPAAAQSAAILAPFLLRAPPAGPDLTARRGGRRWRRPLLGDAIQLSRPAPLLGTRMLVGAGKVNAPPARRAADPGAPNPEVFCTAVQGRGGGEGRDVGVGRTPTDPPRATRFSPPQIGGGLRVPACRTAPGLPQGPPARGGGRLPGGGGGGGVVLCACAVSGGARCGRRRPVAVKPLPPRPQVGRAAAGRSLAEGVWGGLGGLGPA